MRVVLSFLLYIFLALPAYGQITVGGAYSKEEIAKAKAEEAKARAIINAADGVKLKLEIDQFECVHPKKESPSTSPLLWITNDETIVERIEIDAGVPFMIRGVRAGDTVKKTHYFSPQTFRWAVLIGNKEGAARLVAAQNGVTKEAPPSIYGEVNVTVGKGPKPPDPPGPDPTPDPTPIPAEGFRVLMVLETFENSGLPSSQIAAINSQEVRQYLNAKCAKVNNWPEWRLYDKDIAKDSKWASESSIWKDAMARDSIKKAIAENKLPWILISTGKTGYEGPLPKTTTELMALLKRFGG